MAILRARVSRSEAVSSPVLDLEPVSGSGCFYDGASCYHDFHCLVLRRKRGCFRILFWCSRWQPVKNVTHPSLILRSRRRV